MSLSRDRSSPVARGKTWSQSVICCRTSQTWSQTAIRSRTTQTWSRAVAVAGPNCIKRKSTLKLKVYTT